MPLLKIDVRAYLGDLTWTQEDIYALRGYISREAIKAAHMEIVELAEKRLHSTRNQYIAGLAIDKVTDNEYTISLLGVLPNMLEDGCSAFDMKKGLLDSSKAKYGKNGKKYITIPFSYRTSAASATSGLPGQILPRAIYNLIRDQPAKVHETEETIYSTIDSSKIGAKFQPKPKIVELENKAGTFIPKSSIYAGLQRTQNKETGKSAYNTFRRVSEDSDAMSWIHPGLPALNLMDQGLASVNVDNAVEKAIDEFLYDKS